MNQRTLPPLNALRTFEAAARHCSFKAAAEEICVTQSAISRQVQLLEEFYGLALFVRSHRQVELTPAGQTLYQAAHQALQQLTETSAQLLQQPHTTLSLLTTSSFANLWLAPRLKQLHSTYENLQLRLISQDGPPQPKESFAAAVTLGWQQHDDYQAELLFSEQLFPICSAEFYAEHQPFESLQSLIDQPLLDLDREYWQANHWSAVNWQFWLQQFEPTLTTNKASMTFSHFPLLLDAVKEGLGIGIGWQHLVQNELDKGTLVRPMHLSYHATDRQHYFVYRKALAHREDLQQLRQWLLAETASLRQYAKA